jgi:hypothetical protein
MLHRAHEKRIVRFSGRFSQRHPQAAREKALKCRELCGIAYFVSRVGPAKTPEIGKRFLNLRALFVAGIQRNSINASINALIDALIDALIGPLAFLLRCSLFAPAHLVFTDGLARRPQPQARAATAAESQ